MRLKRTIALLTVFVLAVSCTLALSSCNQKKTYNVGICQLVTHDALDAATQGFQDALKKELGEENVTFDLQNAAGDSNTCATIVNSFVSKNYDLIMANATPALQAAANATTTIPVLGTSITEYGVALSIKDFSGTVGTNVSGTSDLAPLSDQAQMLLDVFPNAKNVGLLYCSAEANSEYQVAVVENYLKEKDVVVTRYSFADSNDVAQVTEKAAAACDVIYIPTDNTAASCADAINNVCLPKKVPVVAGEEGIAAKCGAITLSISYYNIGEKTGQMAAKILKGESKIEEMAIEYDANPVKKYNKEICEQLGVTVPSDYTAIGE